MDMTPKEVVERVKNNPDYVRKFEKIFGEITFENIRKAIGAYERTLLTYGAYDRFLNGDNNALNPQAKRGFSLFIDLGCKGCHTGMAVGGLSMQKFPAREVSSIYDIENMLRVEPFPFENKGGFLGRDGKKFFRVPILRNVTKGLPRG